MKAVGKFLISGLLAFLILNFLTLFYFNSAVRDETPNKNETLATNWKYEPNQLSVRATEGYGVVHINNDGYVNEFDYTPNMPISILMMGSSQVEAVQVNANESMSYLLNDMVGEENTVYNIGISAHYLLESVKNLKSAIEKYNPKDYVVIETNGVNFTEKELTEALNSKTSDTTTETENQGFYSKIKNNEIIREIFRKMPFLRLAIYQIKEFQEYGNGNTENNVSIEFNEDLTNQILEKIKNETSTTNVQPIIFYHPYTTIDKDGNLILSDDEDSVQKFADLCEKNGIYFLDMSERFKEEYEKNYILPYGFSNTSVGKGHLNKYGHEMVAEELYKLIKSQGGEQ